VENSTDVYQIDPQTKKISEHSSSIFKFGKLFNLIWLNFMIRFIAPSMGATGLGYLNYGINLI